MRKFYRVVAIASVSVVAIVSAVAVISAVRGLGKNSAVSSSPQSTDEGKNAAFPGQNSALPQDLNANKNAPQTGAQSEPKTQPKQQTTYNGTMTADQKRRAMQITNVFENGTPANNYAAVVNLNDGRGYTSGIAGFTTGTYDAALVIQKYDTLRPNNVLQKYLPAVQKLSEQESGDVFGLAGYPDAWRQAATDPLFRQAQDAVANQLYWAPAMKAADNLGLMRPLSRAILYDTIIQHGGGDDPDSLSAIVSRTNAKAGGTPKGGVDEEKWITAFLSVRKADLLNAYDVATRATWRESAGRCDQFLNLIKAGNWNLNGPIHLTGDYEATIQ